MIGYNDYFGWFDAGGGTTDDRDALGPYLDSLHACYPSKALFVSEFGFEANRNGPVEVRGTYQFQANAAEYHLGVFASKPYLTGAMWFALQTFAARPGWTGGDPVGDPPWVQKGEVDQFGNPTPLFRSSSRSIARRSRSDRSPRRRLGVGPAPRCPGFGSREAQSAQPGTRPAGHKTQPLRRQAVNQPAAAPAWRSRGSRRPLSASCPRRWIARGSGPEPRRSGPRAGRAVP